MFARYQRLQFLPEDPLASVVPLDFRKHVGCRAGNGVIGVTAGTTDAFELILGSVLDDLYELFEEAFELLHVGTLLVSLGSEQFLSFFIELAMSQEYLFKNFQVSIVESIALLGVLCDCGVVLRGGVEGLYSVVHLLCLH